MQALGDYYVRGALSLSIRGISTGVGKITQATQF